MQIGRNRVKRRRLKEALEQPEEGIMKIHLMICYWNGENGVWERGYASSHIQVTAQLMRAATSDTRVYLDFEIQSAKAFY